MYIGCNRQIEGYSCWHTSFRFTARIFFKISRISAMLKYFTSIVGSYYYTLYTYLDRFTKDKSTTNYKDGSLIYWYVNGMDRYLVIIKGHVVFSGVISAYNNNNNNNKS